MAGAQNLTTAQAFRDLRPPTKPMGAGWVAFMLSKAVQRRLVAYPLPGSKGRLVVTNGPVHLIHNNVADLITQARTVVQGSSLKTILNVPSPWTVAPPGPFVVADYAGQIAQQVFGTVIRLGFEHSIYKRCGISLTVNYGPYTGATARQYTIFPSCDWYDLMVLAVSDNQGLGQIFGVNPLQVGITRALNPGVVLEEGLAPGEAAVPYPLPAIGTITAQDPKRRVHMSLESLNLRDIGAA